MKRLAAVRAEKAEAQEMNAGGRHGMTKRQLDALRAVVLRELQGERRMAAAAVAEDGAGAKRPRGRRAGQLASRHEMETPPRRIEQDQEDRTLRARLGVGERGTVARITGGRGRCSHSHTQ